jgi:hypothetical protein
MCFSFDLHCRKSVSDRMEEEVVNCWRKGLGEDVIAENFCFVPPACGSSPSAGERIALGEVGKLRYF